MRRYKPEVQGVVLGDKRAGKRTTRDRLHHRRFDFQVAPRVEESADRCQHAAPGLEDPAGIGVDDEIEIPLPIPDLDVGQAVPFLGERDQTLGEELQVRRPDRQLVRPGSEDATLDTDEVAPVEQAEDLEIALGTGCPAARRPGYGTVRPR